MAASGQSPSVSVEDSFYRLADPGEMAEWYRTADILVVPSWYEPFGMVVLEGMINGLAVAASAVGGPAEILRDGKTGLLFPPRDARALAQSILQLVLSTNLRSRIANAGRPPPCGKPGYGHKSSRRCAQYTRKQYRLACRASLNGAGIRWVEIDYAQMVYLPHDTAAYSLRNTIVSS